jgi:hypothetical protein
MCPFLMASCCKSEESGVRRFNLKMESSDSSKPPVGRPITTVLSIKKIEMLFRGHVKKSQGSTTSVFPASVAILFTQMLV